MSQYLFDYHPVHPTTWVYLSSLLMICIFFKFGRFWSVRNLDLILLILLAPGLLLVHFGNGDGANRQVAELESEAANSEVSDPRTDRSAATSPDGVAASPDGPNAAVQSALGADAAGGAAVADMGDPATVPGPELQEYRNMRYLGFVWLWVVGGLWLVRLLLDPTMVRRPLLEPNLSTGGLTFMGVSFFVFLMANVASSQPTADDLAGPKSAENLLAGVSDEQDATNLRVQGPGNAIMHLVPNLVTTPLHWKDAGRTDKGFGHVQTAKIMAILSHLAVVVGLVVIGYRHFGNINMGIGAATLYMMLPYTAMMTGRVSHALPAALLIGMVMCYRRPLLAGMCTGLAIGVVYYPLFLLPLWISFYWQRGLMRFVSGVLVTLTIVAVSLIFVSTGFADYLANFQAMLGIWWPQTSGLQGVWGLGWDPIYRLPVLAAFGALSIGMAIWPAQKNLGTLLSCSAAVMVATQFWHGYGGGLYMAWYLPLALLTIFRPNLEDRVALSVLGEGWRPRRKRHFAVRAA